MLTVASYNIHRCIGSDSIYRPNRILSVVKALDADIVALQEVDAHIMHKEGHQLDLIVQGTGYNLEIGSTMWSEDADYGNAILSRVPILRSCKHDITVDGYEPRGALEVDLEIHGIQLRVLNTHLGLRYLERRQQVAKLLQIANEHKESPLVLMGDFNEWIPLLGSTLRLDERFARARGLRTFPSTFPLFSLDKIFVERGKFPARVEVLNTPLTRRASDHLPVKAYLEV